MPLQGHYAQELQDLDAEADMPIEELLARYRAQASSPSPSEPDETPEPSAEAPQKPVTGHQASVTATGQQRQHRASKVLPDTTAQTESSQQARSEVFAPPHSSPTGKRSQMEFHRPRHAASRSRVGAPVAAASTAATASPPDIPSTVGRPPHAAGPTAAAAAAAAVVAGSLGPSQTAFSANVSMTTNADSSELRPTAAAPASASAPSLPVSGDEAAAQVVADKVPGQGKGRGKSQRSAEEVKADAEQKAADERARIQDVADLASSVQPTGDTLATANVHAEVHLTVVSSRCKLI